MTELAVRVTALIQPLRIRTLIADAVHDGRRVVYVETLNPIAAVQVAGQLIPHLDLYVEQDPNEPARVIVEAR